MRNRLARTAGSAAILLLLVTAAPRIFFYWRDNFSTHFPYRAALAGAPALHLWNPLAGGGQPLAGNPNALAFYPDWILFTLLPPMAAFNLHFLLHWIGGAFAMRALLRQWAIRAPWETTGAALWVLSGAAVSTLAFYNLVPAVTLVPLALLATERIAERASLRAALFLGAAFGLLALAGEAVTLLATAGIAGLRVVSRASSFETARRARALRLSAAIGGAILVALAIASPLLLAWSEIAGETERGMRAYSAETVLAASLSPWQLVEALVGPLRGLPTDLGPNGWSASGAASPWPPLFLYLFVGAIALPALASPPRPLRSVQVAALALLFLAMGRFNPLVAWVVETLPAARALRYPEKLALPFAALAVGLIAAWLSRETRSALDRAAAAAGGALAVFLAAAAMVSDVWSPAMRERTLLGAAIALPLFVLAGLPPSPLGRRALAAITLGMAAIFAFVAIPADLARHYREMPAAVRAREGRIVRVVAGAPPAATAREEYRRAADSAEPVWGSAFGAGYALEKSPDGMYSFFSRIVYERVRTRDPRLLARWSRLAGASAVVTERPLETDELGSPVPIAGTDVVAQEVRRPLPLVHPVQVRSTASIGEAIEFLEREETDVLREAAGPPGSDSDAIVGLRSARRIRDGWEIVVDRGTEGTLLVNESWFRAWRAVDQRGRELPVGLLNVDRIGISIPRGTSSIELRFGRRRAAIAAAWIASSLVLLAAAIVALSGSRKLTEPAPGS
jgi:hypothetical protein